MNPPHRFVTFFLVLAAAFAPSLLRAADAPKKLLVVTTTLGFRHGSIATLEGMLERLARESGAFTLDFVRQPPGQPAALGKDASAEQRTVDAVARAKWMESLKAALGKLSPASLKNYDGVIFASTTGDLPLPDRAGFLDWIKSGHAFIGIHAAGDTLHGWPGYREMLGGEFSRHGRQVGVTCLNLDAAHPATSMLPKRWMIGQEEIYQFVNYDSAKVHELLVLDKNPETGKPGHFPIAWCRDDGKGRVFYTALGHRDDLIDPSPDLKDRKNSAEISQAYAAHVLGGIEWALGLKAGSATVGESASPKNAGTSLRPLLDEKLTGWEVWMGVPQQTVTGLPPGTSTTADGRAAKALGLGNDPKHVYSLRMESGEPVLWVTGEIYGALTTRESFSNYHLHVEMKWGERKWAPKLKGPRDSGIIYHGTGAHGTTANAWKRALEFQVEEKSMGDVYFLSGTAATINARPEGRNWRYDPSGEAKPFGDAPDAAGKKVAHLTGDFERPGGEWNVLDLYTIGQTAIYVVNGHVVQVLEKTRISEGPGGAGKPLTGGQIQMQSEGAEVFYRRIGIESITAFPADIRKAAGL